MGRRGGAAARGRSVRRACCSRGWSMINAVLFDLFETLVTEAEVQPPRASSLGRALGLDDEAFRREWKLRRPLVIKGQLSFRDALAEVGALLGKPVGATALRRARDERIHAKAAVFRRIDPDLVALTGALRGEGIRLAVVSNCFEEDVLSWRTCSLASEFASTVFSFEVGVAKPDAAIYLEATRRLGVDPATALFIGDGAEDELMGAERAGLRAARAVWFVGSEPGHQAAAATVPRVADPGSVLRLVAAG